jgi:hypothetical protein
MWTDTFQVRTLQSLELADVRVPGGYILHGYLSGVHLLHSVGGMKAVMWTDTFQVRTTQSL